LKGKQESKTTPKMKNHIVLIVLVLFPIFIFGQVLPEAFLGKAPNIPGNACTKDVEEIQEFENQIESLLESIETEKERRDSEMEANSEGQEQLIAKKMAQQYGLSENDLKKLQDEDLSDEESDELIDKALQNSSNLSLGEIENLDKLNSEGQKAWADGYGTEKMAEVQYDGQKNREQQLQTKNLYELTKLQKHLLDSIAAIESKFKQQLAEIERDTEAKVLLGNIQVWQLKATELMGSIGNDAEAKAFHEKLNAEKEKYCNKYSSKYIDILKRYESYTKSCITTCYQIESISSRQTKLQTGVDINQEPGLVGIKKVADYLHLLRGAYKYNLFQKQ
jgi:hypothetical protein